MIPERFQRTALLIGNEAYEILRRSHVTVVGLGAVGSHAVEAMARYGLGNIRLADFDVISESNINRQLLALNSTIGQSKVVAAKQRLLDINPDINVETYETFFHEDTFHQIFQDPTDIVVDAIDSFNPKVKLLELLTQKNIPVVSSMGAARKTDPTAIRLAHLSETKMCPLAARIRRQLRRQGIQNNIRCVYSEEPAAPRSVQLPETEEHYKRGRTRTTIGSISYITAIFGNYIAYEILRRLSEGPPGGLSEGQGEAPPAPQVSLREG